MKKQALNITPGTCRYESPEHECYNMVGRRSKGPANSVAGQQDGAAWVVLSNDEEGGEDQCHADTPSGFDVNTTQGQHNLPGSVARPEGPPGHS